MEPAREDVLRRLLRRLAEVLGRQERVAPRLPGLALDDGWAVVARPESGRVHLN